MGITLDKVAAEAPGLLSLAKTAKLSLQKHNFDGQKAKVALVADFSGSMRNEYRDGTMQRLAEKVLAFGTQFDDDGSIDVFVFDSSAAHLGELGLHDYQGGIDRLTRGRRMGTTDYAGAFRAVTKHYGFDSVAPGATTKKGLFGFGKQTAPAAGGLTTPANEPVYALFLTDGTPDDRRAAEEALREASYAPIFWQFLSIGRESIPFLEKLDDMDGRYIDNADYKPVGNVDRLGDAELFDLLLDEYPAWVAEERRRGQIV
jgi:hypothetical protein